MKKYLKVIIALFIVCLVINNSVFAELTQYTNATNNEVMNIISKVLAEIGKVGMNVGTAGIALLLSGLSLILFILLQTVFTISGTTENLLQIPFPDTVIFNKMALFDANFINPVDSSASPISAIQSVIANIYDSFVIIAVAVFTIIAMVIGIKLALSTLASEKAKYKQAIAHWLAGIVMLICLKWILAGLFKINETIVQNVYEVSRTSEMKFEVMSLASIPLIGSTISQIMSWFGANASAVSWGEVPGYLGLVLKYLLEGVGGNFIGSLVAFVVLGQTITIIGVYLKRMFYCLLLGIIGPLVIALDTFNRSTGKNSNILSNWFKNLSLTIFMQSFHAIFMLVLINFMVGIGENLANQYLSSIIIIILTTGLIKFEKVFKQLFGIGDSLMGDLKGGAMKAMATMGAVAKAGRAIGDNSKKYKDAEKRKASLTAQRNKTREKLNMQSSSSANGNTSNNVGVGDVDNTNNPSSSSYKGNAGSLGPSDEVVGLLRNISNQMEISNQEKAEMKLENIEKELGQAEADLSGAKLAKLMTPVNVAAGIGFGLGLDDMAGGAMLTTALDHASEKVGARGADKTRSKLYDEAKAEGRDNPEILREKMHIAQTIKNTVTLNNVRDVGAILSGKYDSDKATTTKSFNDYKYIAEKNKKGHTKLSSSVDNVND